MSAFLFVFLTCFFASYPAASDPSREIIVRLRPAAAARVTTIDSPRLAALGASVVSRLEDGLPPAVDAGATRTIDPFGLDPGAVWLLRAADSATAAAACAALGRDPGVQWAEINASRDPALWSLETAASAPPRGTRPPHDPALAPAFPRDPHFQDSRQWGLRNPGPAGVYGGVAGADIGALDAWRRSTGSNDVLLAIADTGIDEAQPDLNATLPGGGARIVRGVNITAEASRAWADSFGHGTPVAGVAAALTHNAPFQDSLGVAGVCGGDGAANFGCRIVPIKIAPGHSGPATSWDIARAMLYAQRAGARAMNLSYAGSTASRLEREALHHVITRGCVVVAAAGNRGGTPDLPQYPAAYAADGLCIQVGGTDASDQRAYFSSHGPGLDVMAPAVSIWTTYMTHPSFHGVSYRGYVAGTGTSFATPHVTGLVGLLAAARPELTDTDFQNVIRESADDIGAKGRDRQTGWGRVNAARALEAVRPSLGVWHDEAAATRFVETARETLWVDAPGLGTMGGAFAEVATRIEASATVALPDSFLDSVRVWPRVGGTTTLRGDFRVPYFAPRARVDAIGDDAFTLSGSVYRVELCRYCSEPEDHVVPLPLDQARFGFTVIGRVDRPPTLRLDPPSRPAAIEAAGDTLPLRWVAADPDRITAIEIGWEQRAGATRLARLAGDATGARLVLSCPPHPGPADLVVTAIDEHGRKHDRTSVTVARHAGSEACPARASTPRLGLAVTPNPFRGRLRVVASAGARLTIHDLAGRTVRTLDANGDGEAQWDGTDDDGRDTRPGLYFVRAEHGAHARLHKVVRLD